MPRPLHALFGLLLSLACALHALAQSARWEPAAGTLARDQISALSLVFDNAEPKTNPAPPTVVGLNFEPNPSRSEQSTFNVTFGSQAVRQRTLTYTFRVRPTQSSGEVRIPAFSVDTDQGPLTVPAAGFSIAAATVGQTGLPLDQIAHTRFEPPAAPIWAGEVFRLTHVLDVEHRYASNSILASALEWTPAPLIAEEWTKPTGSETMRNGQRRFLVTQETRAIAPAAPAGLAITPTTQAINLPTGQAQPFALFGQSSFQQFTLTSEAATLQVRPLPSPAPADYIGAVGNFTLKSKVVPQTASVGEPITWTLTLSGTGNWPQVDRLRPRALSRDFRVVSPRAQKAATANSLFEATLSEDLVLIPQKAGRTILGPYALSIFNPSTGRYETLSIEPVTIEITGTAAPSLGALPASADPLPTDGPDASATAPEVPPAAALPPRSPLPSDPLSTRAFAAEPFARWPRPLLWLLPLLGLPALLWLGYAAAHARRYDPLRARREAHAELNQILARLELAAGATPPSPASPASNSATPDLLAWQRATRTLFGLANTIPCARDLPDPLWAALWVETERALYRPSSPLAPEWFAQARQVHAQSTPPARSSLAALRPAHLFPRLMPLASLVIGAFFICATPPEIYAQTASAEPTSDPATDAFAAYAAGDFATAETVWRSALGRHPLDGATRHNLALALAQQGEWDEAAAHAYAAHLQAPTAAEPRLLLEVTLPKISYRAPLPATPALLLAPRSWQILALSAAAFLLLSPAALIVARYAPPARGVSALGTGVFLVSLVALSASWLALRAYGPAAHPEAVLVWRDATLRAVPTEVGEQKVTSSLPAGTVARIDKPFLGWRRLALPDGTTGWVRVDALVGLWRVP